MERVDISILLGGPKHRQVGRMNYTKVLVHLRKAQKIFALEGNNLPFRRAHAHGRINNRYTSTACDFAVCDFPAAKDE
jgi:hypothetical protein